MNNKISMAVSFAIGAVIGSAVSIRFLKNKYINMANEEIESVKEVFRKKQEAVDKSLDELNAERIKEYSGELRKHNYAGYSKEQNEGEEGKPAQGPYIISPDDYGEFDDYKTISLTYYSVDKVLADDDDNIVDDVANTVGEDVFERFNDDDYVFVRDDWRKIDYEILCDNRSYSEVAGIDTSRR